MTVSIKRGHPSRLKVIRICLGQFAINHPHRLIYFSAIGVLTLGRNAFRALQYWIKERTLDQYNQLIPYLIFYLLVQTGFVAFNFVKYFLFETYLAKYGASIASMAMREILYCENYKMLEASGSRLEYYVTEGSKEMAKISRQIALDFFSKFNYLIIDHIFLYYKDKTPNKIIFRTALIGSILLTAIKFYYVVKSTPYLKKTAEASYDREKTYTELLDNIAIVKTYNNEDISLKKYKLKTLRWRMAHVSYRFMVFFGKMIYESLGIMFKVFTTMYYIFSHSDTVKARDIGIFMDVMSHLLVTGVALVKLHQSFEESYSLTENILAYLAIAREGVVGTLRVDTFNDALEIKNVTYAARGKVIFNDVSMTLRKGDKAALYGPNGTGKSSLFKIIMNLDEYGGSVELDGTDIRNFLMTDYRSIITYVPQDTRLFDETIYANLAFGNNKSYEEIVEESKRMGIHGRVMMLPNGYNTVVGEGGRNLNGGLRQKIFYTRAMLRDTAIYLFDEPTNNLDEENARFLMDYLGDEKYRNKTMLVICHDKSIVEKFPKIYRFSNGKIEIEKE